MRNWIVAGLLGALILGVGAPVVWGGDEGAASEKAFAKTVDKMAGELQKFLKKHGDAPEASQARSLLMQIYTRYAGTGYLKDHLKDAKDLQAQLEDAGDARNAKYLKGKILEIEMVGNAPPAIEAVAFDGKPITLEQYKGKVVLIDFWATWCGPCIAELPNVKAVYAKYKDKGFDVLAISLDSDERQTKEQFTKFLEQNDMPWRQIRDGKGWQAEIAALYGVSSIPKTYLLDKEGNVVEIGVRGEALEPAVAKLLGEVEL